MLEPKHVLPLVLATFACRSASTPIETAPLGERSGLDSVTILARGME